MVSVDVYTKSGNKAETVNLNPEIFEVETKSHELLKQAYVAYQANSRTNIANTLTKGEIRGGGRKPWRQKGTGRARHGSIRSPIWRGGGITFGPSTEVNFKKNLSTRSKQKAVKQALSMAVQRGTVKVIESLSSDGKTKTVTELLKKITTEKNVLLVVAEKTDDLIRSCQNIADLKLTRANYLNVFDTLNADQILIEKSALEVIDKWLSSGVSNE